MKKTDMKRLMMTTVSLMLCLLSWGTTVTLPMSNYFTTYDTAPLSCTDQGITLTASGGTTTEPAYNAKKGLCIYAGGTLTINAGSATITAISFTINADGIKQLADLTCSSGTLTQASQVAPSWAGSASQVVFTVGANATYGSSPTKAGQLCFTSITITTDGQGSNGGSTSLYPEYPLTAGQVLYYGTEFSTTPNYQLWLYSDSIDLDLAAGQSAGYSGSILRVDLFRSGQSDMTGTYTVATDGNYDRNGAISKTYSYWTTYYHDGSFVEFRLTSGTVTIECVTSSSYTVTYDLQEINNGMRHTGVATAVPVSAVTSSGAPFALTNSCSSSDLETISPVSTDGKMLRDGHLFIMHEGHLYDAFGRLHQ